MNYTCIANDFVTFRIILLVMKIRSIYEILVNWIGRFSKDSTGKSLFLTQRKAVKRHYTLRMPMFCAKARNNDIIPQRNVTIQSKDSK